MKNTRMLSLELVLVTFNRLEYLKKVVNSLFNSIDDTFEVVIWDNGSSDGTREYIAALDDSRISRKVYSKENIWVHGAANKVFGQSKADLIGILNDDIILNPGWTKILEKAHRDIDNLGFVGCWHLGEDFFDEKRAMHKIFQYGEHKILRHPWTGGASGLIKRKTWCEVGPFESKNTKNLWCRVAKRGYINGFYYPLICVEHMDYVWSNYYMYKDDPEKGLKKSVTASYRGLSSVEEAKRWHNRVVTNLLDEPWDVKYYTGWRKLIKRIRSKINTLIKK